MVYSLPANTVLQMTARSKCYIFSTFLLQSNFMCQSNPFNDFNCFILQ